MDLATIIHDRIPGFAERTFTTDVVADLIAPTLDSMLSAAVPVTSVSFVISLWAGSSAMSCYIAAMPPTTNRTCTKSGVAAHLRACSSASLFLAGAVIVLPLVAIGLTLNQMVPDPLGPMVWDRDRCRLLPFVGRCWSSC